MRKKLLRWLNFNRPPSATLPGWKQFYTRFKKEAPVRYFFYRVFPRYFRRFVSFRIKGAYRWFQYRFMPRHRYHVVKTQLKPDYHEVDTRLVHAVFALLCDYVEIELAALQGSKKYRDKEAGKRHLRYRLDNHNDEDLAIQQEILELYTWWYEKYLPFDEDSNEELGPFPVIRQDEKEDLLFRFSDPDDITVLETVLTRAYYDRQTAITEKHHQEVDEMLTRACKIRRHLWT